MSKISRRRIFLKLDIVVVVKLAKFNMISLTLAENYAGIL